MQTSTKTRNSCIQNKMFSYIALPHNRLGIYCMYNVRVYKTKIFSQILILLKVWRSPYIRVTLKAASKHIIMLRQSIKLRAKKTLNQATGGINQRPLMPCSRARTQCISMRIIHIEVASSNSRVCLSDDVTRHLLTELGACSMLA